MKENLKNETPADANNVLAPVRVLNLYACLGGNRLLWENCKVTAVIGSAFLGFSFPPILNGKYQIINN